MDLPAISASAAAREMLLQGAGQTQTSAKQFAVAGFQLARSSVPSSSRLPLACPFAFQLRAVTPLSPLAGRKALQRADTAPELKPGRSATAFLRV